MCLQGAGGCCACSWTYPHARALTLAAACPSRTGQELALAGSGAQEPSLVVQPWWLGHLERPQGQAAASSASEGAGALRVLRWAYGAVVNATAAQITERRRELLAGRSADRALMDLYEEVAQLWRRLNEIGTKKSHLQGLRCA